MKRKILCSVAIVLLVAIASVPGLGADSPTLRNDMPQYLKSFQMTVNRQVRAYPDSYFLSGPEDELVIALTFDDGPDGKNTALLLDLLAEEEVSATFFVLGEQALQYPDLLRRIASEGHELGNHSFSHPDMRKLTNEHILQEELESTSQLITDLTGLAPMLMRPPYGALRDETIEFLAEGGWTIINWSIDSFDWDTEQNSASEITQKVLKYRHPGAIVLMHTGDGLDGTITALPAIIASLREEGYRFVTISQLLAPLGL
ncbi:MAG: polysaccharide deacetylase family protein [Limnochordia bacterium]|nr:polysaccharide deacetylase family protein [Limnochordia bacterium]